MKETVTDELTNAFLDLELNNHIPSFRNEHKEEYSIIFKLVDIFKILKNKLVGKTIQKKDLFLISAIVELDRLFQSAVILFERGLPESANIIIRTILELSFNIVDAIYSENHSERIIEKENRETNNTLNIIKKYNMSELLPNEETGVSHQKTIYSNNYLDSVKAIAEQYGLKREYILYRTFCCNTHMSASILAEVYETSSTGVCFDSSIKVENFKNNIALLLSVVMMPIQHFVEKFIDDKECTDNFLNLYDSYITIFK